MSNPRGLTSSGVVRGFAGGLLAMALLVCCLLACEPRGAEPRGARAAAERPWRVNPSLYPVAPHVRRDAPGDATLVVTEGSEATLDGRPLKDTAPETLAEGFRRRVGPSGTLWILGDEPEPDVLMGWLQVASAAGFQGFGVSVWGVPRGDSDEERAYGRVQRFELERGAAGLTVQIAPRRAQVRLDQCEVGSLWCQRSGAQGRAQRLLEARSGVSLFGALRQAAPHWARSQDACVVVEVLAPVSIEHLLNASAIAASVPWPERALDDGSTTPTTTRAALFDLLRRLQGRHHCVRLRLPR